MDQDYQVQEEAFANDPFKQVVQTNTPAPVQNYPEVEPEEYTSFDVTNLQRLMKQAQSDDSEVASLNEANTRALLDKAINYE